MYFVISNSDGDTRVRPLTREELLEELNETESEYLNHVPDADTNYWGGKVLIIKGEIVTPQDEHVIVRRTID